MPKPTRKPVKTIGRRLWRIGRRAEKHGDQSWFFHPEMQARIAEAEADFLNGRSHHTTSPEEDQALLDSWK